MRPLPGISAKFVDDRGNELVATVHKGEHVTGYLVLDQPWPSMLRGIWGDTERYVETYWSRFAEQGWYFAGDSAYYDRDGAIWVVGRIDDVMNVSGTDSRPPRWSPHWSATSRWPRRPWSE
jgi:acetyl-CoA synthetase